RDVEIEVVDRPGRIAAARVLDGQPRDHEVRHQPPPKASAGSTATARRRPTRLATRPTTRATTSSLATADARSSTANGKPGVSRWAMTVATSAAVTDSSTACNASPPYSERLEAPVALNTAKSRRRSRTDM